MSIFKSFLFQDEESTF